MDKSQLESFMELAKFHKQMWVECTQRGDMPPTVIGIRDGKPQLMAVAPQIDQALGFQAINIMRRVMAIDQVIMIVDAHVALSRGKTGEEQERLYKKYRERGSMQKACDEDGACAHKEISDCIIFHYLDDQGQFYHGTWTYDYHGKEGGVEFKWTPEHSVEPIPCRVEFNPVEIARRKKEVFSNTEKPEVDDSPVREMVLTGRVPCTIVKIMEQLPLYEEPESKEAMSALGFDEFLQDKEKMFFHAGVSTRRIFNEFDFLTMEYVGDMGSGSYEEYVKDMADRYASCIAADLAPPMLSLEEIMARLDEMEAAAEAANDGEALLKIRHFRQQIREDQAKGERSEVV